MTADDDAPAGTHQIVFYRGADGDQHVQVLFREESFWLPQKAIAELFAVEVPAINKHSKNIFESGELLREPTISILEIVQKEGTREVARQVEHYSLDAIIAVGYRVNSYQATQFRISATKTLREFVIKGSSSQTWRLPRSPPRNLIRLAQSTNLSPINRRARRRYS